MDKTYLDSELIAQAKEFVRSLKKHLKSKKMKVSKEVDFCVKKLEAFEYNNLYSFLEAL